MDKLNELTIRLLEKRITAYWNSTEGNWKSYPHEGSVQEWARECKLLATSILSALEK